MEIASPHRRGYGNPRVRLIIGLDLCEHTKRGDIRSHVSLKPKRVSHAYLLDSQWIFVIMAWSCTSSVSLFGCYVNNGIIPPTNQRTRIDAPVFAVFVLGIFVFFAGPYTTYDSRSDML